MAKIQTRRINSPFLTGIFVIAGMVVVIVVVFWLSASQFLQQRALYASYFETSVEGLETGSAVKYQGVPVGTISDVQVAPDGRMIEVIMQIDKKIIINDSLRAKAEIAGIAGGKFIQLYYPKEAKIANMYPALSFEPTEKLIRSAPSGLEEIEIAMREVMNNMLLLEVDSISSSTIRFLTASADFFSNEDMYTTIRNLSVASDRLKGIAARADTSKILEYIAHSSSMLYQTTNDLKLFAEKLNEQIDNLQLDKYVENAFLNYDSTMISTRRVIQSLGLRSQGALYGLSEVIEEIKATNKELQRTLRAINDHPSQVFLSEPPPPDE